MKTPNAIDNGDGTWNIEFDGEILVIATKEEMVQILEPFSDLHEELIQQIADGIASGGIFCSGQIRDQSLTQSIFMPLLFMDAKTQARMLIHEASFLYEHFSKAGPRSINGYPIFFSMQILSKSDGDKVSKIVIDEQERRKQSVEN